MKRLTFTYAFASALTILIGLAQVAHAQAPALELRALELSPEIALPSDVPPLRIEALREETRRIDVATPAVLTALGGVAAVGGLVTAGVMLFGWSLSGVVSSGLGGGAAEPPDLMLGGLAVAAVGLALLVPSAIWLRAQTRRARTIRRELRELEEGIAFGLGPSGVSVRGTF